MCKRTNLVTFNKYDWRDVLTCNVLFHCITQVDGTSIVAEDRKPKISIVIDEERCGFNFVALLIESALIYVYNYVFSHQC